MNKYEELVSVISKVTEKPESFQIEDLERHADQYFNACQLANQRLGELDRLLTKGLRSEAIMLSQSYFPELLEMVQILDFHMLPRWNELCERKGIKVAPFINGQIASDLNKAHAMNQTLAPLLASHRRYALTNSSLKDRLAVLYQICEIDSENELWEDDIALLEKERVEQIDAAFNERSVCTSYHLVSEYWAELNSGRWTIEVPIELLQKANIRLEALQGSQATQTVIATTPEIKIAIDRGDFPKARSIITKCDGILSEYSNAKEVGTLLKEYFSLKQVVIEQFNEEQRIANYKQALVSFKKYLLNTEPSDVDWIDLKQTLRRRYGAIQQYDLPIPSNITDDYHGMIHECDRLQNAMLASRKLAWVVGIIGTLAIVGLAVFASII